MIDGYVLFFLFFIALVVICYLTGIVLIAVSFCHFVLWIFERIGEIIT